MKKIIRMKISKSEKYFVAEGEDLPVVTQGKTLEELASNIREAVALHFDDEDVSIAYI